MASKSRKTGKQSITDLQALQLICDTLERLEERQRAWVLETAASRMQLSSPLGVSAAISAVAQPAAPSGASGMQRVASQSPSDFIREKQPVKDEQRVACLAAYLRHARGVTAFKAAEISHLNTEAGGPHMDFTVLLNNAVRQSGYLSRVGGGKKQLSAYGEDVVNALPNQEAVRQLATRKTNRRPRKSRSRKSKRS
jgi:hypothetical protein